MKVKNIVASIAVFFLVIGLTVYGVYYKYQAEKYERALENQYNRAFNDMMEHVNSIEEHLLKAMATGTPQKRAQLLEDAWNSANQAAACLSILPVDHQLMYKIQNFLVQLGDISYSWNKNAIKGAPISDEDYKTLSELYGYASDLTGGLSAVYQDFSSNRYNWHEIQKESSKMIGNDSVLEKYESLGKLSAPFEEYPQLIYDGPFSMHMSDIKPKGLKGEKITPEQGAEKIKKYFSGKKATVKMTENNQNANIKTFGYTVTFEEEDMYVAYVDLTETGGMIYSYLLHRQINGSNLDIDQATEAGIEFLKNLGVTDMKSSYYITEDNIATINYSYYKDDIMFYPDMMKVKVALDNGEVIGLESHAYITSHHDRDALVPKISSDEALEVISPYLKIESVNKAVIPNDYGGEHFVYEFKCTNEKRDFLVYIDANDGSEVDVLILLESDNGVLTV